MQHCRLSTYDSTGPRWTWTADLDADGVPDRLVIALARGQAIHDRGLWAGGGDRFEGLFTMETHLSSGKDFAAALDRLFYTDEYEGEPMSFPMKGWKLCFFDYNLDGRQDFALCQYLSSVNHVCKIFTVSPAGITELPMADRPGGFPCSSLPSPRQCITPGRHGFSYCFYSRIEGREVCRKAVWDERSRRFVEEKAPASN